MNADVSSGKVCICCGSDELRTLPRYSQHHLSRCGQCGLTFASWRPTAGEIREHYEGYGDWPDSELTRRRYRELLDELMPYRSTGRLFEMGCGAGYFLEEADQRGWEAHGTTVGGASLELCQRKKLRVLSAEEALSALPAGQFDVAAAFEVVEHLRDPNAEAALLSRVLRPGGIFYCTTPNFDSLARRLLGPSWRVIAYPEHLNYFTAATLARWLDPFGFRLLRVEVTGISPGEFRRAARARAKLGSRGVIDHLPGGAGAVRGLDERLRSAAEAGRVMPSAKRFINAVLSSTRLGDTLKAWFVRVP